MKFNLLKNTLVAWAILFTLSIFQLVNKGEGYTHIIWIGMVGIGIFYSILLILNQYYRIKLTKNDNGVEVGGNLTGIFNGILFFAVAMLTYSIVSFEPTLARGPVILLFVHSYVSGNSAIVGDRYIAIGFSFFKKDKITDFEVKELKLKQFSGIIKLNNGKQITITRSKEDLLSFAALIDQKPKEPLS
ncbi:hypothetical protein RH915_03390 [Serpentinicella sp. ANB-PHB4]|uniref:hypothetical protein n=1 Tax=Serpentinicella sp. ANB-PHB4 TaxID=3074076 RepID=UPI002860B84C|nr:hypothetical protein [Serpentinicella sp. ANB-PHB4]MDR5658527.1 hypothetical protein [Serpentinicella sp. ANB-PHB4]